jgi:hypothetical protein
MTDIIYRAFPKSEPKVSKEKREATFSFASDLPVPRYFGLEVLGMDSDNVDRERIDSNNLPLLLNHDTNGAIGAVRDIWQDSGKSYARVKLSHVRDAEDLVEDWSNDIRTGVSVGYRVLKMQPIRKGDAEQNGPDVFKALLWKPVEVSAGVPTLPSKRSTNNQLPGTKSIYSLSVLIQVKAKKRRNATNPKRPAGNFDIIVQRTRYAIRLGKLIS